jgi:hypothetical protein
MLKLFQVAKEIQLPLPNVITGESWSIRGIEALNQPTNNADVWVVFVEAASAFMDTVWKQYRETNLPIPKAVLWAPRNQQGLSTDEWWETFHAQLHEENEADCLFLERIARCFQTLDWSDRIDAFSQAQLDDISAHSEIAELPFHHEAIAHLKSCSACQEEVYTRLEQRAEIERRYSPCRWIPSPTG